MPKKKFAVSSLGTKLTSAHPSRKLNGGSSHVSQSSLSKFTKNTIQGAQELHHYINFVGNPHQHNYGNLKAMV